jgi:glycine/D-amino acid oxidase-like deaminating enzyme
MNPSSIQSTPCHNSYDVVIVGGAMLGSSAAWFLSDNSDFNGRILVVEMDPSYEFAATSRTNSCIRQQFSSDINIRISQFGAEFIKNFRAYLGGDPDVPKVPLLSFGYMYLAADEKFADVLRQCQSIQAAAGAGTKMLTPDQIAENYPFYNLDGIVAGSHNPIDEGYFEGSTLFDWWKRKARQNGVEYVTNEVVEIERVGDKIESVQLKSGERIAAGHVVNASGTRGAVMARKAGIEIPIEPRRRYTFIFDAAEPIDADLPLTIDPSGVHVRADGRYYLAGCPPHDDTPVAFDDFEMDHGIWEDKAWPAIANRIPRFERVKLINTWICHYDFNLLDQNAIIGPAGELQNFILLNGFSGHGFQQSPAMGRGVSELISYGEYRTLDLSSLGYGRILRKEPLMELAII